MNLRFAALVLGLALASPACFTASAVVAATNPVDTESGGSRAAGAR